MSFSTAGDVTIADETPADVDYSEVQNTGSKCLYADRTRDIGTPRGLEISHQNVGTGDDARLRSMVKLSNSIENSALEGDVVEHRAHIVLDTPLRVVTKADVIDIVKQLTNFIDGATFVDQIMNKEV
jgi:hypothetical protein